MTNPALVLRGGNSGPTFSDSTPGYVLTIQADGKSVKPEPGGGGGGSLISFNGRTTPAVVPTAGDYDASDVTNDAVHVDGASVADALDTLQNAQVDHGNVGASLSIDVATGNAHTLTLTAACSLTLTNLPTGIPIWLELTVTQDAAGSRGLTIVGAKTQGAAALALSTTPLAVDIVSISVTAAGLIRAVIAGNDFR